MKVIVQRSKESSVSVEGNIVGKIKYGYVLLVGFTHDDTKEKINKMIDKILKLRLFNDENEVMNKSIIDIKGEILSISQFTLYADCKKGNRPSYINAMKSNEASLLYEYFNNELEKYIKVEKGIFGSDMLVSIENDGPITINLDN